MIKILNLYAGIGGNRKLWDGDIEVTAVELDSQIAKIYQDFFPKDKVVIGDAHKYLLEHYKEFDFIWSSPPCPTHSICNKYLNAQGCIRYPDMALYQEIIFLQHFFKGKYCVENVKSYYRPLIDPQEMDRHYYWANFVIPKFELKRTFNYTNGRECSRRTPKEHIKDLQDFLGIDCDNVKMLHNCVHPKLGLHIFNSAFNLKQTTL
jgi:DNA (cytosine-5)-methyltransferase 1